MNNLTTTLLHKNKSYSIEEWGKQGRAIPFDSGREQRIVNYSIPAIELTIDYVALTGAEYETLRTAYENNNSNTFIFNLDDETATEVYMAADYVENQSDYVIEEHSRLDMRPEVMSINASVWAFKDFHFKISAQEFRYSGKVTLITSVFFNFPEYQNLFSQTSSYTRSLTSDVSFFTVLSSAKPNAAELKYVNNAVFSNIGESVRHARNKGGLKRAWTLYWLLEETNFLKLLQFYRKKSGIMGEFGMPDYGSISVSLPYVADDYIESQDDYVLATGGLDYISNARFMQDSLQYQKRLDGMYQCKADILEVKN